MPPKFIQITATPENDDYVGAIYALAEDGSVWRFIENNRINPNQTWSKLPEKREE